MSTQYETFKKRLEAKETVVAVIGLGYVGMPLAVHFVSAGLRVIGVDSDPAKIESLKRGESYVRHISADWAPRAIAEKRFFPVADYDAVADADAVIICVPTPLNSHREPDLRHVEDAGLEVARRLKDGALVSLESTTYPGTTMEVLLPLLSANGKRAGEDFFLVFSPEREDPGNPVYSVSNIPKVIGGVTPNCAELAALLYGVIFEKTVLVSRPAAAELCKLLENIFRSVNIALVNELKLLCDKMDLDVWEIIDAAATKPFGYMPFYPGPGLGGHCIPIDPFYLTWKAREYGFTTRFIELSGEINTSMPRYVVSRVMEALNRHGKALNGAKVLLLGAAYKKDVNDLRESPSLPLMSLLEKQGARVSYNDPYIPVIENRGTRRESVELNPERLAGSDVVLIATAHSCYDPEFILEHAHLVVDTRNMTRTARANRDKIVRA
jgi:UDP-N-acetyl-D-glucosamine dehydrogenase